MENPKQKFNVKKLQHFIRQTSKEFFIFLLEDHPEEKKEQQIVLQQLQRALAEKKLVVLQVEKNDKSAELETVAGFILSRNFQQGSLLLRPLKEPEALRLIPLKTIKKVGMLTHRKN